MLAMTICRDVKRICLRACVSEGLKSAARVTTALRIHTSSKVRESKMSFPKTHVLCDRSRCPGNA